MSVLIINADDFGANRQVNKAILESFMKGLCSSMSILANGSAFSEACEMGYMHKFDDGFIGIHLNLTHGLPLTESIRKVPLFCNERGEFDGRAMSLHHFLDTSVKKAVGEEIRAQISRCINAGIKITHADSHHHIHTHPGIFQIVIPLLREAGISKIRLSRNCGPGISLVKKVYKLGYNSVLRYYSFKTVDYFGSIEDVSWLLNRRKHVSSNKIEVMVHPQYDSEGNLTDLGGRLLSESLKPLIDNCSITSYL